MTTKHEELCEKMMAAMYAVVNEETTHPDRIVEFLEDLAPKLIQLSEAMKMLKMAVQSGGDERMIGPKRESLPESDRAAGWDAGNLVVYAVYDVEHKYKDDFQMQVWDADGPWIYGMLVAGNLKDWRRVGIALGNRIAVRRCYCRFTLTGGELILGGEYDVDHHDHGRFRLHVDHMEGPWVLGRIGAGGAKAPGAADYLPGEPITLRRSLCTFTLAAGSEAPAKDT